jgi:exodeoxyribonuclease V alpha subunit
VIRLSPHGTAWLRAGLSHEGELPYPHALAERLARTELGVAPLALAWELVRLAAPHERDPLGALVLIVVLLDAGARGATAIALDEPYALLARAEQLGFDSAELRALEDALRHGPAKLASIVGGPEDARPLVLAEGRLALARHVVLEDRLARVLSLRGERTIAPLPALEAAIARAGTLVTPSGTVPLAPEQLAALRAAVLSPQVLIAGGPGTGKTSIVAAIVRALAGGDAPIVPPSAIALAAPTGKAADRIYASLTATLRDDASLLGRLARAETVHRLLGYRPSDASFTFHAASPLPQRLVIVDEVSMLDLALAERLVAALAPDARLVLLGDPDQLPSIDPGAVLADLSSAEGEAIVPVARLSVGHRADASDPGGADVRRVAAAMRTGSLVISSITELGASDAAASHASGVARFFRPSELRALLGATFRARFAPVLELAHTPFDLSSGDDRARLDRCLAMLSVARLLTVTRTGGPSSADGVNAALGVLAGSEGELVPGEPLLAHHNDYERELRNGDQGMAARIVTANGTRLAAIFVRAGQPVAHPIDVVRGTVERAYATTVHKAQGSEHEHVVLVLPEQDVPVLLGRALLYTAITRARKSVLIVGDPTLLERGVKRATHRVTGLRSSLARVAARNGQAVRGD